MRLDPHVLYETKRGEYGPVVPVVLDGGVFAWLVLGYAELLEVTRREYVFSRDSRHWRPREGSIPKDWPLEPHTVWRPNAVFAGGEEHARLRGALTRALGRVSPQQVRRFTSETGHRLIDAFCASGRADLVQQYAGPLPLMTLMRLFGFPAAPEAQLQMAIPALLECGDQAREADRQIMQIVADHVARRHEEPAADITSWLIQDEEAGLDDNEICEQIWLTLNAGQGATSIWIANIAEQMVSTRM
ncbi:cytochrome P450, partial [Streptomyces sp. NPDC058272]